MNDAVRNALAALAGGASVLGGNLTREKAARDDDKRATDRALALLREKPQDDDVQIVQGEDADGPGFFAVSKRNNTVRRVGGGNIPQAGIPAPEPDKPSLAMSALTGGPPPISSSIPGNPNPPQLPASPPPVSRPAPTLRPIASVPKAPAITKTPRSFAEDGVPMEGFTDQTGAFYRADGSKATGKITPIATARKDDLITTVGVNGKPVRAVDRPGIQPYVAPSPTTDSRMGAREDRLQQNFQQHPAVKQAAAIANAAAQLYASAAQKTPQGDLNMLYGIVKLRDPNSAVREGEIDLQRAARSVGTQVVAAWQKAKSGKILTDQERSDILKLVDETVEQQAQLVAPVQKQFGAQARTAGADSAFVAPDPFQGIRRSNPSRPPGFKP